MTQTDKKTKKRISKNYKRYELGEVVYKYPESAEVLMDYGLHCVGCFANAFDYY
jgi:hypothetical protein